VAGASCRIRCGGGRARLVGIHRDERVQLCVMAVDAFEEALDERGRGESALVKGRAQRVRRHRVWGHRARPIVVL
jgi:hypothetical protein